MNSESESMPKDPAGPWPKAALIAGAISLAMAVYPIAQSLAVVCALAFAWLSYCKSEPHQLPTPTRIGLALCALGIILSVIAGMGFFFATE